jgi:hypothetical protein
MSCRRCEELDSGAARQRLDGRLIAALSDCNREECCRD